MTRRQLLAAAPAILTAQTRRRQPNILFAIADDQSWLHTSATGDPVVRTPAFDRVANNGVLFTNTFCPAPQCAPTRASILTGRPIWSNEEAGTHASLFPRKLTVYPQLLEQSGYFVGLTGKGAGPVDWKTSGWPHNPAGRAWDTHKTNAPEGVSKNDYAANFAQFLTDRPKDKPFCFWLGSQEPHRPYRKGWGLETGKKLDAVRVPPFLPDTREVRSDLLDYFTEIEYFDDQVARALQHIEKAGELDNTLVIVTADNGMSFPGAKATMYEYGWHLPMAVQWPARIKPGRRVDDLVSFIDLAPTYLEAAGLPIAPAMMGRSLVPLFNSARSGAVDPKRDRIYGGRERHSHARFDNLGYPARAIRTREHLYIWNLKPDRWPAGDPDFFADIDDGPSKSYMLAHREHPLFAHSFGKRPEEELFDIRTDPGCLKNLAADPRMAAARRQLRADLEATLKKQGDPRMSGSEIFDSYPRTSPMRPQLGGFAEQNKYNPKYK
ncbi:MAG: sulfatase [Bryobacterales bacterium]|nr:sulfatase [Bryobacterales bacterium]